MKVPPEWNRYTERTDKMKSTTTFREWSQQQRPQTPVRPTFYTKKSKEEEYPPLGTPSQSIKMRTEQQQGPAPSGQGPVPSDLGRQGPSLATRIATAIKIDEQNILTRRAVEKPKALQGYDVLPISQYGRLKFLSERKERAEREAAAAADEHEYRWQISQEVSREKFDSEYGVEPISLPDDLTGDQANYEENYTENEQKNPIQ